MSKSRHPRSRHPVSRPTGPPDAAEPLVRGYAVTHPPATVVLPIEAGWDQLLYAASGVMTISTPSGSWVIPPHRALWVSDGVPVTIRTRGRVAVRTLYLAASLRALPKGIRAFSIPPLARELVLHAVRTCPLDLARPTDAAMLTLLMDQLRALPEVPLQLPRPADARAAEAADVLLDYPAVDLTAVAARVGASRRTLERAFARETGMTLGAWRRRARMLRALEMLAAGVSVTTTAMSLGYSTPSSFVASFRHELGQSPRQLVHPS